MPSAGVTVRGLVDLKLDLAKLARFFPIPSYKKAQVGQMFAGNIKARTLKGVDAHGNPFTPYSDDYAEYRRAKGRKVRPVNLFFKGHMLAAIGVDSSQANVLRLFFRTPLEGLKAHGHTFGSTKTGLPQRDFFAITQKDLEAATTFLTKDFKL